MTKEEIIQKLIQTGFTREQAIVIIQKHEEYGVPFSFLC